VLYIDIIVYKKRKYISYQAIVALRNSRGIKC